MQLKLIRTDYTTTSTIGDLYIDGVKFCYTIEDVVRPKGAAKVPGKTAIPAGTYRVIVDKSTRFGCLMPLLLDVPGFAGIRIHTGNTDKDTEGCLIVGTTKAKDFVGQSRDIYNVLFPKLQNAYQANERITIEIVDTKPSPLAPKTK